MDRQKLIEGYQTNTWLIHKHAEGVTHEESLLRLPVHNNNFNWVLGHIVQARDGGLVLLGGERLLDKDQKAVYDSGSEPLAAADALPLQTLLSLLDTSLERLAAAIENASDERLDAIYDEERGTTVGERIAGLNWHETYHLGQLEILRRVGSEKPAFP